MSPSVYLYLAAFLLCIVWIVKSWHRKYQSALQMLLYNGGVAHDILKMVLHTPAHYFILFADKHRLKVDAVNSAFAEALGYPPEQLEGMTYTDLIHPDDTQGIVVPTYPDAVFTNRYRKADGSFLAVTWRVLNNRSGVVIYSLGETHE